MSSGQEGKSPRTLSRAVWAGGGTAVLEHQGEHHCNVAQRQEDGFRFRREGPLQGVPGLLP